MKTFGFSTARNSWIFATANFEVRYAEKPGRVAGGNVTPPALFPIIAAWADFIGRKTIAAMTADFTFVYTKRLVLRSREGFRVQVERYCPYLVALPVIRKLRRCNWGRRGEISSIQDERVPFTYRRCKLTHCLFVCDIGRKYQAKDIAIGRLYHIFCL